MKKKNQFRCQGRTYDVEDVVHLGPRRLLVVRRLSSGRYARFKVIDPNACPGGELRTLHRLPLAETSMREVRQMERISRSHLPFIQDWQKCGDEVRIVTNWIRGRSLAHRLQSGEQHGKVIAIEEAIRLFRGLVHGLCNLHFDHAMGHGDIKPENLIVTPKSSRLVLIDFGNSWSCERAAREARPDAYSPGYVAPEIQDGEAATWLSDQYSATVVLYRMLMGQVPPLGDREISVSRHLGTCRYFPRRFWRNLDDVISTGLQIEPDRRFQNRSQWSDAVNNLWLELQGKIQASWIEMCLDIGMKKIADILVGDRREAINSRKSG